MNRQALNQKGTTLIEILVSTAMISIIVMAFTTTFIYSIKTNNKELENLRAKQSTRFALNYIEKRVRECDQHQFQYHKNTQTIKGKNYEGTTVWIDLSGKKRSTANTLLYFYRDRGELRVNKNNENNVLVEGIKEIYVREIIEGQLLEIEVLAKEVDYSVKTRFKINY